MDLALVDFLLPKLLIVGFDITSAGNSHLYLMFIRSIKKAKEMLSDMMTVCHWCIVYYN